MCHTAPAAHVLTVTWDLWQLGRSLTRSVKQGQELLQPCRR